MDNFKLSKLLISSEYKKINVNVTVKSRIIKDESERNKGEHLLRIENDRDMKGLYGQGKIGGLLVRINAKYLSNILNGRDDNTLPHEFGHTLGLLHVDGLDAYFMGLFTPNQYMNRMEQSKDPYNMMFSGKSPYMNDKKSVKINLNQLQIIINNIRNNKVNHE